MKELSINACFSFSSRMVKSFETKFEILVTISQALECICQNKTLKES